jgi:hypothetical protein
VATTPSALLRTTRSAATVSLAALFKSSAATAMATLTAARLSLPL